MQEGIYWQWGRAGEPTHMYPPSLFLCVKRRENRFSLHQAPCPSSGHRAQGSTGNTA